ncbi:hypothetical protein [Pelosinus sp. IPA-1]|uniref:hypothetical protein n=1 Tax=Pelosinus sp. IPA-1 TaxID=3029569 RepID=UPI0025534EB8|nr:hypothetical protein [Pelosinus sp. IPA-1]
MNLLKDKFTRGFFSGVAGGLAANVVSLFFGFINFTTLRFADWTGIIIFGHTPPFSTGEILFSLTANIGFTGFLGIVFTYLIPLIKNTNLLFKGWVFSTFIWFFIYSVTALFKVEGTMPLPLNTAIANVATTSIYGLVLAATLGKEVVKNATESTRNNFRIVPAMKPIENNDDDNE